MYGIIGDPLGSPFCRYRNTNAMHTFRKDMDATLIIITADKEHKDFFSPSGHPARERKRYV